MKIKFTYNNKKSQSIKNVYISGPFNNWSNNKTPMKYNGKNKSWKITLELPEGIYPYKFVINGEDWLHDPYAARFVQNDIGTLDSIKIARKKVSPHGIFEPVHPGFDEPITLYSTKKAELVWCINEWSSPFQSDIQHKYYLSPMEKAGKNLYKYTVGPFNKGEFPEVVAYGYLYKNGTVDDNHGKGYWIPIDLKLGGNTRDLSLKSKALKSNVNFRVYFPKGYDETKEKFPIMVLIHGYGGSCKSDWTQQDIIKKMADIYGVVLLWPDGNVMADNAKIPSWYINSPRIKNSGMEDHIIKELLPFMEKNYKIKGDKSARAIGGISMGGFGSFYLAAKYNEYFCAACSMSAIYNLHHYKNIEELNILVGRGNWSKNCYNSIKLIKNSRDCSYYFIVGSYEEEALEDNYKLKKVMENKKIPHEFHVYPGDHTNNFWRLHIQKMMEFACKNLCQKKKP